MATATATANNTLAPIEQASLKAYEEMTPELKKIANDIDKKLSTEARGVLLVFYDIGVMVRNILENESTYGQNAIELLATRFSKSSSYFYNRKNFTKLFTREEVEKELAVKKMTNGNFLTPSHVEYLTTVSKAADRRKLLDRVFSESMSAERLQQEIQSTGVEKKNKRFGGRKPKKPATPLIAAQQVTQRFQMMENLIPIWQESMLDEIDSMEPEKAANPVLLQKLQEAQQKAEDFEGELSNFLDRLRKNVKRIGGIVEERRETIAKAEKENKKDEAATVGKSRPARRAKA